MQWGAGLFKTNRHERRAESKPHPVEHEEQQAEQTDGTGLRGEAVVQAVWNRALDIAALVPGVERVVVETESVDGKVLVEFPGVFAHLLALGHQFHATGEIGAILHAPHPAGLELFVVEGESGENA